METGEPDANSHSLWESTQVLKVMLCLDYTRTDFIKFLKIVTLHNFLSISIFILLNLRILLFYVHIYWKSWRLGCRKSSHRIIPYYCHTVWGTGVITWAPRCHCMTGLLSSPLPFSVFW